MNISFNRPNFISFKSSSESNLNFEVTGAHFFQPTEIRFSAEQLPREVLRQDKKDELKGILSQRLEQNRQQLVEKSVLGQNYPAKRASAEMQKLEGKLQTDFNSWTVDTSQNGYVYLREDPTPVTPPDPQKIKNVFGRAKVADIMPHHNQVLDVYNYASQTGTLIPEEPIKLIHFDTHSDLIRSNLDKETIGDWINTVIRDKNVSDVYWVLPDWTKQEEARPVLWKDINYQQALKSRNFSITFNENIPEQRIIVDTEKQKLYFEDWLPEDYREDNPKYRTVTLHKTTLAQLEEVKGNVHVDFCGDYFSNIGRGDGFNYNASQTELAKNIGNVVEGLTQKGIQPQIVTMATSPAYTPEEDLPQVKAFYHSIVEASTGHGLLLEHQHQCPASSFDPQINPRIPLVPIKGNSDREAIFQLDKVDSISPEPNGIIDLKTPESPKLRSAKEEIMRTYALPDPKQAEQKLVEISTLGSKPGEIIDIGEVRKRLALQSIT